uniref:Death domain-containing protein n=1 Tax=Salvator merianae TaxID=96440 RepID=A0A8D0DFM7_SALMN
MFCHRRRRRATSCSPTAPSVCTVPANFSLSQPGSEDTTRQGFAHSVHHPLLHAGLPPPHVENALGAGRKPPHHTAVGEPLHGRNLYVIIDAVPVRRWKEFVRGLGLRDGEIELVELEHTLFREQQYEMLKRWSHQQGASLATVLAVLEDMQLGGCAQQLSEQLQAGTVWGGLRGGGRELGCSARPPPWEGC